MKVQSWGKCHLNPKASYVLAKMTSHARLTSRPGPASPWVRCRWFAMAMALRKSGEALLELLGGQGGRPISLAVQVAGAHNSWQVIQANGASVPSGALTIVAYPV